MTTLITNTVARKAAKKQQIIAAVNAIIDAHPKEYHPILWDALLREVHLLEADTSSYVPVLQAIVDNTSYTLLQVATNISNTDISDRERLATVIAKQINDIKSAGV